MTAALSSEQATQRSSCASGVYSTASRQSASHSQTAGQKLQLKLPKCLLMSNTGPTGNLDHDRCLQAMLQLCNTPDPDCNLSSAQIMDNLGKTPGSTSR